MITRRRTDSSWRPDQDTTDTKDSGRALMEVVVLGVLVMLPVIYVLLFLLRIQAGTLAVTEAARAAGRIIQTSSDVSEGLARAEAAAHIALSDQQIPSESLQISFASAADKCGVDSVEPVLAPGATYAICVTVTLSLPAIPAFLSGSQNTTTGVYLIHIDELREG